MVPMPSASGWSSDKNMALVCREKSSI
jgi:hypothetical protein